MFVTVSPLLFYWQWFTAVGGSVLTKEDKEEEEEEDDEEALLRPIAMLRQLDC